MTAARERGTAVLLVDLQNDYVHPDGAFAQTGMTLDDVDGLLRAANRLVAAARAAACPVIWATTVWDDLDDGGLLTARGPVAARRAATLRGTWGVELHGDLDAAPTDLVVEKRRFSAFFDTDLRERLRDAGISRLVVGGVRTDFCVESTVRDAFMCDIDVVVATDAVAGYVPALHESSLRAMGTVFAQVADLDEACRTLAQAR